MGYRRVLDRVVLSDVVKDVIMKTDSVAPVHYKDLGRSTFQRDGVRLIKTKRVDVCPDASP